MSDNTDLLRLFASLSLAIDKAEHKPGQWAETAQSMGGICCPGAPFDISKPWAKEEPWANFSFKRDSWLAVAAVNALPQLLALIAENARLVPFEEAYATACNVRNRLIKENELLDRLVVTNKALSDSFRAERDQLRAEVAGLRTGYEAYEQVNAELKAENERLRSGMKGDYDLDAWLDWTKEAEELRKDAEQWRALVGRAKSPVIGYTGCVICGAYTDHGGLPCPKTRAAANALSMGNQRITPVEPLRVPHPLDAALGQGEQS